MAGTGTIARVAGVVLDAEFASGDLPSIHNALTIQYDDGQELVVEVHEHIDPHTVRAVAMGGTAGLRRGLPVLDTGHPIRVPVGQATLGRMFNVLGQPIDGGPAPEVAAHRPIHAPSPPLREQRVVTEPFITGIKAIDLLTHERDLLEMYCDCIIKNKSIGIYDGGYKCVELATGRKFERTS